MIKLAARAGLIGPFLFGGVVTTLTILKYDFLRSLGWDPIYAPTFDWPSGLALGNEHVERNNLCERAIQRVG